MSQGEGVEMVGLYVRDQEEARAFYVDKVGFRVHTDVKNGAFRWLTLQYPEQPSFQLGIFKPGPPTHDASTAQVLEGLVAKGAVAVTTTPPTPVATAEEGTQLPPKARE